MSKKTKSSKKLTLTKLIPTPITDVESTKSVNTVEVSKLLKAISSSSTTTDMYSFLCSDLTSKIDMNDRNTVYWKTQISFLEGNNARNAEITEYKKFIKQNKKITKEYKKALSFLKKATKHFGKGNDT